MATTSYNIDNLHVNYEFTDDFVFTVYHYDNYHCRYIDSNNRKALTYSLAVNHLTDLSNDELKMMRSYRHTKGAKGGIEFTNDVSNS